MSQTVYRDCINGVAIRDDELYLDKHGFIHFDDITELKQLPYKYNLMWLNTVVTFIFDVVALTNDFVYKNSGFSIFASFVLPMFLVTSCYFIYTWIKKSSLYVYSNGEKNLVVEGDKTQVNIIKNTLNKAMLDYKLSRMAPQTTESKV